MDLLLGLGWASKEIFDYNRENYKFDQEQRLEKDMQRVEMQIKRFDLFREDIDDLVKLTVSKMDMYHVVGALFLSFTALIYCEGIINKGDPPDFFMGQYLLTVASAFAFLLVAVWLAMYASIASHSFGVRLRTRYVRLPIPNLDQIQGLTTQLSEFEQQKLSKIMRLPLGPQGAQNWKLESQRRAQEATSSDAGGAARHTPLPETNLGRLGDVGFAREDILMEASQTLPGKHVELFRKLQAKWQSYDAYARVAMALGVYKLIQSVNYYVIGLCLIEKCAPSCAVAVTIIFQACTFGILFLDLSGISKRLIIGMSVLGSSSTAVALGMLIVGNFGRGAEDSINSQSVAFYVAPAGAFLEAIWLQVFMELSRPSNDDAGLPRKFRMILYLDVFGNGHYDPTEAEHAAVSDGVDGEDEGSINNERRSVLDQKAALIENSMAQGHSALRRWEAVPEDLLSADQQRILQGLREDYQIVRRTLHGFYARKSRSGARYNEERTDAQEMRSLQDLSVQEQSEDEFHRFLLGPLQRLSQGSAQQQYYNVEAGHTVWDLSQDSRVLNFERAKKLVTACEQEVNHLLAAERGCELSAGSRHPNTADRLERKKKLTGKQRLPWKTLRRMTGVLQFCWVVLGVRWALDSAGVPHLFWSGRMPERRLRNGLAQWPGHLEELEVRWPHGSFFRPESLACQGAALDSTSRSKKIQIMLGSPYFWYRSIDFRESQAVGLELAPLPAEHIPAEAVVVHCASGLPGMTSGPCLAAMLRDGGKKLVMWQISDDRISAQDAVELSVEGRPWLTFSGVVLPCQSTRQLLALGSDLMEGPCLLLASWDGTRLPLAAVPLAEKFVSEARTSDAFWSVSPRVDAPISDLEEDMDGPSQLTDNLNLHLTSHVKGGRLWALLPARRVVLAWDMSSLRTVGRWQLSAKGEIAAICEASGNALLLAGHDATQRPQLWRSLLPWQPEEPDA